MIAIKLAVAGLGAAGIAVLASGGSPSTALNGLTADVSTRIQAISGQPGATNVGVAGQQMDDVVNTLRSLRTRLENIGNP